MDDGARQAWVIAPPGALPDMFVSREQSQMVAIPLDREDLRRWFVRQELPAGLGPEGRRLLPLISQGLTATDIARDTRLPVRTVQRQIAEIRDAFGARSYTELVALVARAASGGANPPGR